LQTELRIITDDLLDPAGRVDPAKITLDMIVTPDFYYCVLPRGPLASFIMIVNNILIALEKVKPQGKEADDLQCLIDTHPAMKCLAAEFCDRAADRCDMRGLHEDAQTHRARGHTLRTMTNRSAGTAMLANIESELKNENE
jgi:hypothetical protein